MDSRISKSLVVSLFDSCLRESEELIEEGIVSDENATADTLERQAFITVMLAAG